MGFNSAFKGLKFVKSPGNGRLNNLNDPVLSVLSVWNYFPFFYQGGYLNFSALFLTSMNI